MTWIDFVKLVRFAKIYGPRRAVVKALGRMRIGRQFQVMPKRLRPGIGIIGCGQFAYSTIAYFVRGKARIVSCYDVDTPAAITFGRMYGAKVANSVYDDMLMDPEIECIYVATNHASHGPYAIAALEAGKRVYVEKPVAVTHDQLAALLAASASGVNEIYAGYNRPFASAIRDLREYLPEPNGPLTLSCFISGHRIPLDHWYRRPEEGTRICGNVGHWLDLAVHLVSWRNLPDRWRVSLAWSDRSSRDDDIAISLVSECGDLISIVLTARTEPFEGINECINLQWDRLIVRIDDFRRLEIHDEAKVIRRRYWPKDVGHRRAVLQPFGLEGRAWTEVELSSLLMLRIAQMVTESRDVWEFSFSEERAELARRAARKCSLLDIR